MKATPTDRPWLQVIGNEKPDHAGSEMIATFNDPFVREPKPKKKKPSRTKARQRKGRA